jgi:hypothetical protein
LLLVMQIQDAESLDREGENVEEKEIVIFVFNRNNIKVI